MNFFTRTNIVIWVLAGLLVLTVSMLGTVLYRDWFCTGRPGTSATCVNSDQFLGSELGLNRRQMMHLNHLGKKHRMGTAPVMDSLRTIRTSLVTEMSKDNPDTNLINAYVEAISRMQGEITRRSVTQYLEIRQQCTPEQRKKLSGFYYELMGCCPAGQGRHMMENCRMR